MSSRAGSPRGRQLPRLRKVPGCAWTDGPDAVEFLRAYGVDPDPWQVDVLDAWFGRNADNTYSSTSCGLSVPRQNGKNAVLEWREAVGAALCGERILHTAHEVKTSRKAFERLVSMFAESDEHPELAELVSYVRRTNGQEAIAFRNGGSVEFSARSRGAARGYTVDIVVFDEAQELTDEQMEALLPTLAAAPSGNRQFIYTGTPPGPGSPGEVFSRTRRNAWEGLDDSLCWHEWSVDRPISADTPWEEVSGLLLETNPAVGYRIDVGFCQKEYYSMSHDGFSRERLGWWSEAFGSEKALDKRAWEECRTDAPPADGLMCCGVKFSPDGSRVALAVCLRPLGPGPHMRPHVEVVDSRCAHTSRSLTAAAWAPASGGSPSG